MIFICHVILNDKVRSKLVSYLRRRFQVCEINKGYWINDWWNFRWFTRMHSAELTLPRGQWEETTSTGEIINSQGQGFFIDLGLAWHFSLLTGMTQRSASWRAAPRCRARWPAPARMRTWTKQTRWRWMSQSKRMICHLDMLYSGFIWITSFKNTSWGFVNIEKMEPMVAEVL